jgi:hypothetical protein
MSFSAVIFFLTLIGLISFILSVVFRRKRKPFLIFNTIGITFGLIPLLGFIAFKVVFYMQERPMVGRYVSDVTQSGIVELKLFDDNSFEMRSDSCAHGFVQGDWGLKKATNMRSVEFTATSQNMGKGEITGSEKDTLTFINIPVCLSLISTLKFTKAADTATARKPDVDTSY